MALTIYIAAIVLLAPFALIGRQREPLFIVVCLAATLAANILEYHHLMFF